MNTTQYRGLLIAFEGIDGTGKSTQARLLTAALKERGYGVVLTREPTDGPWGRKIRAIAARGRAGISAEEEATWFKRDRAEHVAGLIEPALAAGSIVVTDRYYFSTMAYQGALGLDVNELRERNERIAPRPDLTIILTSPVAQGLGRIAEGRPQGANIGYEQAEFLERVAAIFAALEGPDIVHLDGGGAITEVRAAVWRQVEGLLSRLGRGPADAPTRETL